MQQYETMYVLRPKIEEEAMNGVVERFKTVIEEQGGVVDRIDRWGKRRLAYEIDKETDGIYMLMHFKSESHATKELDRILKISGDVLRHIIVKEG